MQGRLVARPVTVPAICAAPVDADGRRHRQGAGDGEFGTESGPIATRQSKAILADDPVFGRINQGGTK